MSKLVSVIIPNFNHAPYLKQRIDSVLEQTYQDFEVIILDDCSTDNSREIIECYKGHEKVSYVIYNTINSGSTFKQWNKGIELAKGEYIWIAESDDWCEPTLLATLIKGFNKNPECVISYCQSYCVVDNEIVWRSQFPYLGAHKNGKKFIKEHMTLGNDIFNASMCLFKKDSLKYISQEFKTFKLCGDWLFWIEIAYQGEVFISGSNLNYFRKHDKDVSGKAYQSGINFIEELKILKTIKALELIDERFFLQALKRRFLKFKCVKNSFDKSMSDAIIEAFFIDGKVKKHLQKKDYPKMKKILSHISALFD